MKLTREQQKLQDLWDDIRTAYNSCPQTHKYDKFCPFNDVESLLIAVLDPNLSNMRDSLHHTIIELGWFSKLSVKTKQLLNKYYEYKLDAIKRLALDVLNND